MDWNEVVSCDEEAVYVFSAAQSVWLNILTLRMSARVMKCLGIRTRPDGSQSLIRKVTGH